MKELEFDDFVEPLEQFLELQKKEAEAKKAAPAAPAVEGAAAPAALVCARNLREM